MFCYAWQQSSVGRPHDNLKRFHSIGILSATVQRVLKTHGLGRLPAIKKHQRSKKRLYQFTAIDDYLYRPSAGFDWARSDGRRDCRRRRRGRTLGPTTKP
jgi:hypothetical protein